MTTDLAVKQNPLRSLCFVIITVAGLISAPRLRQHGARFIKGDDFAAGRADINAHQAHDNCPPNPGRAFASGNVGASCYDALMVTIRAFRRNAPTGLADYPRTAPAVKPLTMKRCII